MGAQLSIGDHSWKLTAGNCRAEAARGTFWRLKAKGHIMVGITSYQVGRTLTRYIPIRVGPTSFHVGRTLRMGTHNLVCLEV